MRSETISLLLAFLCLSLIPVAIFWVVACIGRFIRKKQWPSGKDALQQHAIEIAITVGITLIICLVFKFTGFFESQFYRPSKRDYGLAAELGLKPESVNFNSEDGTKLNGWFLAAENPKGTVICYHGSDLNITNTVKNTYWLNDYGLNVFVFDYRGYGASEGAPSREGLVDDSVAAIDYVLARDDVDPQRLILMGQSMGGQLAINAAALRTDVPLKLVVSEATYASHSYHIAYKLGQFGPLWLVNWGAWLLTSDAYAAEDVVGDLEAPLLVVHGSADKGVAPYHAERLIEAAPASSEIWRYQDYGHLKIFRNAENQQRLAKEMLEKLGDSSEQDAADSASEESAVAAEPS